MHSQPPPQGSLEELFRHHLLESEAAAVPPRPLVWEHIDNSLLLAQNEKYRRRLLVYRRSLAASLLLAALAGGGWWQSQRAATATLASANAQREAARRAVARAVAPSARSAAPATLAASATSQLGAGALAARGATTPQALASPPAPLVASRTAPAHAGRAGHYSTALAAATAAATPAGHSRTAYAAVEQPARGDGGRLTGAQPARTHTFSSPTASTIAATTTLVDSPGPRPATSQYELSAAAPRPEGAASEVLPATALATSRLGEEELATRLATLLLPPAAGLPTELAMKELPAPAPTLLRHWRYGAEYTIGAFQPNIDFNRSTTDYNTALGYNTVSLTRAATAEYRANLRAGLSQRLTLRATRWLGGRWSLSTGVAVAQQDAYSATSAAFTGEQLADVSSFAVVSPGTGITGNTTSRDLHESSFRYRSVGVPFELQYDNQAKPGLSFYGRLGAIVSALLSVRSEVAGNPEATRTYSFMSASTPYRRLTALLRGSAGVRYRPASRKWGLNVGPTAEAGVQSMNTETDRSFLQQSRPYSVGIEAGIEFGGGLKLVQ